MRRILSIFGTTMGLAAMPAMADTCAFSVECFEEDACAETSFTMEVTDAEFITDAETIGMKKSGSETTRVFFGETVSAVHMLTVGPQGDARYSVHLFDEPMMINYAGSCAD